MAITLLALLAAGLALQLGFFAHGGHEALSDLPRVFVHRRVGPGGLPYVDRVIEYPVGAGVLMYAAWLVHPSAMGVLVVTAVVAAALALWVLIVLERRVGARAWRWALAPALLVYAFQNWDVFAIAALLGGLLCFERRRDRASGVLIGVGALVKLFPAVVLPVLVARRWADGDRRGARRLGLAAAATIAIGNLPFALANRRGWWWTQQFQGRRQATWGTIWYWLYRAVGAPVHGTAGVRFANGVSILLLLAGLVALTWWVVHRRIDVVAGSAAAVALFLVTNKVYSPTYDVWLVAFFVLLPVSRRLWVAFCAVDLAVYVLVFGAFHGFGSRELVHQVLPLLVVVRLAVIASFAAVALRPRPRSITRPFLDRRWVPRGAARPAIVTDR